MSPRSTSVSMTTKVAHTSDESKVHFSLYDNKSGSYFRWVQGPLQSLWQQKWLILQMSPRSTSVSMTTEVAHTSDESKVHFSLYDNRSGSCFRWVQGPLQSLWQQKWLILQISPRSTSVSMTTEVAHTSDESKVHFSLYDNRSGSYFRWVQGPLQSLWQQKWLILQMSPRSTSVSKTRKVTLQACLSSVLLMATTKVASTSVGLIDSIMTWDKSTTEVRN